MPLSVLIEQYDNVLELLKHTVKKLSETDLLKKVPYEDGAATIRWRIWHMSDHNRYHQTYIQAVVKEFHKQES
ncbi:DinB family protein [Bacillus swezeyi]|uniref:DinB family protein n=1 Tax=Bacillus swezeyi TaxID=1925020 RepID=UPI001CC22E11|nr:DinB family protein [Bacillus swezeyi]